MADEQDSRRELLKKAAYVAPAILTLKVAPTFAQSGSGAVPAQPGSGQGNQGQGQGNQGQGNQGQGQGNQGQGGQGQQGQNGNNGVGNGMDAQPPGNPPMNDGAGTGPGNPGSQNR